MAMARRRDASWSKAAEIVGGIMPLPLPEGAAAQLRDELIDRLAAESRDEIVRKYVETIIHPAPETDPETKRVYAALATVHSRRQLTRIVRRNLESILEGHERAAEGDVAIAGGAHPVLVGFVIGVASSLAADYLWERFGEEPITVYVQLEGKTLEVTIYPNGSVKARYVEEPESQ